MPSEHHSGESPGPEQPAAREEPDLSRRTLIRGAASLAGAGLAVTAISAIPAPATATTRPARSQRPRRQAPGDAIHAGPVIVHIRDVATGEMDVFAGLSHARLTDPRLAARLVRGVG